MSSLTAENFNQARSQEWQIESVFEAGAAGVIVFSSFTVWSILDRAWLASIVLGGLSALFGIRMLLDYTDAVAILQIAIHGLTPINFRRGETSKDQIAVKSTN